MRASEPARATGSAWLPSVVVFAVLLVAACGSDEPGDTGSSPDAASSEAIQLLAPDEYAAWLEEHPDVPLINVHVPYEGHLAGTDAFIAFDRVLDSDEFPADRSAPVAIYCRSGNMSGTASAELAAAGYETVVDLEGGMIAWSEAGFKVVEDPP